jgi:hypothetical protein
MQPGRDRAEQGRHRNFPFLPGGSWSVFLDDIVPARLPFVTFYPATVLAAFFCGPAIGSFVGADRPHYIGATQLWRTSGA